MEKKIVKIFIGSSITELRDERNELESFLRKIGGRLCERFVDKGIYFNIEPIRCEDVDPAYAEGRAQDTLNHLLENCEVCVFLFFTQAGEYTIEEFNAALTAFRTSGGAKPKIYTFFKKTENEKVGQSVLDFMERLDKDLQHYYPYFDSIDTVKLQLLLHLSILNSDFMEVAFDDGACYLNGERELDVSKASQFANNQALREFVRELAALETEYYPLKGGYPYEDEETNRKYRKLAERRQFLKETIEQLQKEIFNMTLTICKDAASGKEITIRMREAYRLFEQGDLDGANRILNYAEIKDEYLRRKKMRADEQKKDDILYIRELKAKITFLKADYKNADRFAEIEEIYADAVAVAKESLVEIDVLYDYASYLDDQGQSSRAYELAKELERIYESGEVTVGAMEKASVYKALALFCDKRLVYPEEAGEYYKKAIELAEEVAKSGVEHDISELALIYNNYATYCRNQREYPTAKQYLYKALKLYKDLFERTSKYGEKLAMCHNNLAIVSGEQGDLEDAEINHLGAISIRMQLAAEDPQKFNPDLASSCSNIAIVYDNIGDVERAVTYYAKAIELYEDLLETNPGVYGAELARCFNNLAALYLDSDLPHEALSYYEQSIKLYEEVAKSAPERYSADLAISYKGIARSYEALGQLDEAETYYTKAMELREILANNNLKRYGEVLGMSYEDMGELYATKGDRDRANEYYLKAIKTYANLAKVAPQSAGLLMTSCWNYGVFSGRKDFFDLAYAIAKDLKDDPTAINIRRDYERLFPAG